MTVTTFVGDVGVPAVVDGVGTSAQLSSPIAVTISPDDSFALVAEKGSHVIRKIIISTRSVSTFAGTTDSSGTTNGVGTNAQFKEPHGICISSDMSFAIIVDRGNQDVRHVVMSSVTVSLLAGTGAAGNVDGVGSVAAFSKPIGCTLTSNDLTVYISDLGNSAIRAIVISTGKDMYI
jgi:hypothetical protein